MYETYTGISRVILTCPGCRFSRCGKFDGLDSDGRGAWPHLALLAMKHRRAVSQCFQSCLSLATAPGAVFHGQIAIMKVSVAGLAGARASDLNSGRPAAAATFTLAVLIIELFFLKWDIRIQSGGPTA